MSSALSGKAFRVKLLTEVIQSERSYVSDMQGFYDILVEPLAKRCSEVAPESAELFQRLKMDTSTILLVSKQLLRDMEEKDAKGVFSSSVGDIFKTWAPMLKSYSDYTVHHDSVANEFATLSSVNRRFELLVESLLASRKDSAAVLRSLTFGSLLIMPVQRVPRYRLLLESLLKSMDSGDPQRGAISLALASVMQSATHLNESMARAEQQAALQELQRLLIHPAELGLILGGGGGGGVLAVAPTVLALGAAVACLWRGRSEIDISSASGRKLVCEAPFELGLLTAGKEGTAAFTINMEALKSAPGSSLHLNSLQSRVSEAIYARRDCVPVHVFLFSDLLVLALPHYLPGGWGEGGGGGVVSPLPSAANAAGSPPLPSRYELVARIPFNASIQVDLKPVGIPPDKIQLCIAINGVTTLSLDAPVNLNASTWAQELDTCMEIASTRLMSQSSGSRSAASSSSFSPRAEIIVSPFPAPRLFKASSIFSSESADSIQQELQDIGARVDSVSKTSFGAVSETSRVPGTSIRLKRAESMPRNSSSSNTAESAQLSAAARRSSSIAIKSPSLLSPMLGGGSSDGSAPPSLPSTAIAANPARLSVMVASHIIHKGLVDKPTAGFVVALMSGGWANRFLVLRLADVVPEAVEQSRHVSRSKAVAAAAEADDAEESIEANRTPLHSLSRDGAPGPSFGAMGILSEAERDSVLRGALEYYKDPSQFYSGAKPAGTIALSTIVSISWQGATAAGSSSTSAATSSVGFFSSGAADRSRKFDVISSLGRTYSFRAPTDGDAVQWVKKLAIVLELRDAMHEDVLLSTRAAKAKEVAQNAAAFAELMRTIEAEVAAAEALENATETGPGRETYNSVKTAAAAAAEGEGEGGESGDVAFAASPSEAALKKRTSTLGKWNRRVSSQQNVLLQSTRTLPDSKEKASGVVDSAKATSAGELIRQMKEKLNAKSTPPAALPLTRGTAGFSRKILSAAASTSPMAEDALEESGDRRSTGSRRFAAASLSDGGGAFSSSNSSSSTTPVSSSEGNSSPLPAFHGGAASSESTMLPQMSLMAMDAQHIEDRLPSIHARRFSRSLGAVMPHSLLTLAHGKKARLSITGKGSAMSQDQARANSAATGRSGRGSILLGSAGLAGIFNNISSEDVIGSAELSSSNLFAAPNTSSAFSNPSQRHPSESVSVATASSAAARLGLVSKVLPDPSDTLLTSPVFLELSRTKPASGNPGAGEGGEMQPPPQYYLRRASPNAVDEKTLLQQFARVSSLAETMSFTSGSGGGSGSPVDALSEALVVSDEYGFRYARAALPLHAVRLLQQLAAYAQSRDGTPFGVNVLSPSTPSALLLASAILAYSNAGQLVPALALASNHQFIRPSLIATGSSNVAPLKGEAAVQYASLYAIASAGLVGHLRASLSTLCSPASGQAAKTLGPYHYDLLVTASAANAGDAAFVENTLFTFLRLGVPLPARSFNTLLRAYATSGDFASCFLLGRALLDSLTAWVTAFDVDAGSAPSLANSISSFASLVRRWGDTFTAYLQRKDEQGGSKGKAIRGKANWAKLKTQANIRAGIAASKAEQERKDHLAESIEVEHLRSISSLESPRRHQIAPAAVSIVATDACKDIVAWVRSHLPPPRSISLPACMHPSFLAPPATAATFAALADGHASVRDTASCDVVAQLSSTASSMASFLTSERVPSLASKALCLPSGKDDAVDFLVEALYLRPNSNAAQVAALSTATEQPLLALAKAQAASGKKEACMSTFRKLAAIHHGREGGGGGEKLHRLSEDAAVQLSSCLAILQNVDDAASIYHVILAQYSPSSKSASGAAVVDAGGESLLRASAAHNAMVTSLIHAGGEEDAEKLLDSLQVVDNNFQQHIALKHASFMSPLALGSSGRSDADSASSGGCAISLRFLTSIMTALGDASEGGALQGVMSRRVAVDRITSLSKALSALPIFPSSVLVAAVLTASGGKDTAQSGKIVQAVETLARAEASQLQRVDACMLSLFSSPKAAAASAASSDADGDDTPLLPFPPSLVSFRGALGCAFIHACVAAGASDAAFLAMERVDAGGYDPILIQEAMQASNQLPTRGRGGDAASSSSDSAKILRAIDPRSPVTPTALSRAAKVLITNLANKGAVERADRLLAILASSRSLQGADGRSTAQAASTISLGLEDSYKALMVMYGLQGRVKDAKMAFEKMKGIRKARENSDVEGADAVPAVAASAARDFLSAAAPSLPPELTLKQEKKRRQTSLLAFLKLPANALQEDDAEGDAAGNESNSASSGIQGILSMVRKRMSIMIPSLQIASTPLPSSHLSNLRGSIHSTPILAQHFSGIATVALEGINLSGQSSASGNAAGEGMEIVVEEGEDVTVTAALAAGEEEQTPVLNSPKSQRQKLRRSSESARSSVRQLVAPRKGRASISAVSQPEVKHATGYVSTLSSASSFGSLSGAGEASKARVIVHSDNEDQAGTNVTATSSLERHESAFSLEPEKGDPSDDAGPTAITVPTDITGPAKAAGGTSDVDSAILGVSHSFSSTIPGESPPRARSDDSDEDEEDDHFEEYVESDEEEDEDNDAGGAGSSRGNAFYTRGQEPTPRQDISIDGDIDEVLLPEATPYNALMSSFADSGDVELAVEALSEMQSDGVRPDSDTIIALIRAYATAGQGHRALDVCATVACVMINVGCSPEEVKAVISSGRVVAAELYALGCEGCTDLLLHTWALYLQNRKPFDSRDSEKKAIVSSPAHARITNVFLTSLALCISFSRESGRHPNSSPIEAEDMQNLLFRTVLEELHDETTGTTRINADTAAAIILSLRATGQRIPSRTLAASIARQYLSLNIAGLHLTSSVAPGFQKQQQQQQTASPPPSVAALDLESLQSLLFILSNLGLTSDVKNVLQHVATAAMSAASPSALSYFSSFSSSSSSSSSSSIAPSSLSSGIDAKPSQTKSTATSLMAHIWLGGLAVRGERRAVDAYDRHLPPIPNVLIAANQAVESSSTVSSLGWVSPSLLVDPLIPPSSPLRRAIHLTAEEGAHPTNAPLINAASRYLALLTELEDKGEEAVQKVPNLGMNLRSVFFCASQLLQDALLLYLPLPPSAVGGGSRSSLHATQSSAPSSAASLADKGDPATSYLAQFRPLPETLTALLRAIASDAGEGGASVTSLQLPLACLLPEASGPPSTPRSDGTKTLSTANTSISGYALYSRLVRSVVAAAMNWGLHVRIADIAAIVELHAAFRNIGAAMADIATAPSAAAYAAAFRGLARAQNVSAADCELVASALKRDHLTLPSDSAADLKRLAERTGINIPDMVSMDTAGARVPLRSPVAEVLTRWRLLRLSDLVGNHIVPSAALPRASIDAILECCRKPLHNQAVSVEVMRGEQERTAALAMAMSMSGASGSNPFSPTFDSTERDGQQQRQIQDLVELESLANEGDALNGLAITGTILSVRTDPLPPPPAPAVSFEIFSVSSRQRAHQQQQQQQMQMQQVHLRNSLLSNSAANQQRPSPHNARELSASLLSAERDGGKRGVAGSQEPDSIPSGLPATSLLNVYISNILAATATPLRDVNSAAPSRAGAKAAAAAGTGDEVAFLEATLREMHAQTAAVEAEYALALTQLARAEEALATAATIHESEALYSKVSHQGGSGVSMEQSLRSVLHKRQVEKAELEDALLHGAHAARRELARGYAEASASISSTEASLTRQIADNDVSCSHAETLMSSSREALQLTLGSGSSSSVNAGLAASASSALLSSVGRRVRRVRLEALSAAEERSTVRAAIKEAINEAEGESSARLEALRRARDDAEHQLFQLESLSVGLEEGEAAAKAAIRNLRDSAAYEAKVAAAQIREREEAVHLLEELLKHTADEAIRSRRIELDIEITRAQERGTQKGLAEGQADVVLERDATLSRLQEAEDRVFEELMSVNGPEGAAAIRARLKLEDRIEPMLHSLDANRGNVRGMRESIASQAEARNVLIAAVAAAKQRADHLEGELAASLDFGHLLAQYNVRSPSASSLSTTANSSSSSSFKGPSPLHVFQQLCSDIALPTEDVLTLVEEIMGQSLPPIPTGKEGQALLASFTSPSALGSASGAKELSPRASNSAYGSRLVGPGTILSPSSALLPLEKVSDAGYSSSAFATQATLVQLYQAELDRLRGGSGMGMGGHSKPQEKTLPPPTSSSSAAVAASNFSPKTAAITSPPPSSLLSKRSGIAPLSATKGRGGGGGSSVGSVAPQTYVLHLPPSPATTSATGDLRHAEKAVAASPLPAKVVSQAHGGGSPRFMSPTLSSKLHLGKK